MQAIPMTDLQRQTIEALKPVLSGHWTTSYPDGTVELGKGYASVIVRADGSITKRGDA